MNETNTYRSKVVSPCKLKTSVLCKERHVPARVCGGLELLLHLFPGAGVAAPLVLYSKAKFFVRETFTSLQTNSLGAFPYRIQ